MPNTQFVKVIQKLVADVALETGYSDKSAKLGGDLDLLHALIAKALVKLTPQVVEFVKNPLGQDQS